MMPNLVFPFRLREAFFIELRFNRAPEVPQQLQLNFSTAIKVVKEKFPDNLQVNVKLSTKDVPPQPIDISVELVGLFDLVENQGTPEPEILDKFLNERALFILWPYISQCIKQITVQMGMGPINLPIPFYFAGKTEQTASESSNN